MNTQSHNERLQATLNLLEEELKEKEELIQKFQADIARRNDEAEKRTRELDRLNRLYEKLTADMEVSKPDGSLHCSQHSEKHGSS